ncbi:hypothetical protein BCR39DRAFT_558583 [Naematelia encephala]|uniref:Protein kinase domain-containing protein n=1 Tax=Naematelia encephala TaxID=71784 RepID=A0A1Y2B6X6_9TREE|nr:hypothetical protein BCR39DRAFT_558583 [Naematelia encephala]
MASRVRGGQNHSFVAGSNNNKQAHLVNAYQELGKELGSEKLKIVSGYTLGRIIGEGTYGSVHLATHRLFGTRCAIKKIPKSVTPHLTREIHHHRRLHHPHIVQLHEIVATETHVWLVSELCSGGELFDYLVERGRLLEGEARRLFGELTVAVGWMHRQGVVHRDLKLENVLLDGELHVKLADLGFARENQKGKLLETFCGTTGYASPEMLAGRKYLGEETDVWSLGIILYMLLCGGLPFDDDDERVMKDLIMKGEYEEPEWLSEEARSLIRAILRQDPGQRLTIEGILTHPWFKMTLVDHAPSSQSVPPSPRPASPHPEGRDAYFSDTFKVGNPGSSSLQFKRTSSTQSPLSLHEINAEPQNESEPSETSFEFVDSEHSKADSETTSRTTAEEEEPIKRVHSGEFSATERALELSHQNGSQVTIKRSGNESPGSVAGSVKARVAVPSTLAGQTEVDEEALAEREALAESAFGQVDLAPLDDHSLHLPLAQHSRTPSRTKRRSVSSTLSLERKLSHHSTTGNWQTYPPENYLLQLDATRPELFSTVSERALLDSLAHLGFDTGQLMHSVTNNACDSSAATWWILRSKQLERGETDEAIRARDASAARRRERAAAYQREERRKARSIENSRDPSPELKQTNVTFGEDTSIPITPSFSVMDLGAPVGSSNKPVNASPEAVPASSLRTTPDNPSSLGAKAVPSKPATSDTGLKPPQTPPREAAVLVHTEALGSPEASPQERIAKARSPSMSMLQRATSALTGRKTDEKDKQPVPTTDSAGEQLPDQRSLSPTKLVKPPPKKALQPSDPDITLSPVSRSSPAPTVQSPPPVETVDVNTLNKPPLSNLTVPAEADSTAVKFAAEGSVKVQKDKASKKDSLWTTFRHLFNEDRRRRKRDIGNSPFSGEVRATPTVVLSRGISARTPHVNRLAQPAVSSRRTSLEGVRPQLYSHRSSSVNSRHSSVASLHSNDLGLRRRASSRSHGSQTPTSDREYPSRPSSALSAQRHSSQSVKSPTLQSDHSSRLRGPAPASPLHSYHRRPTAGSASTRVRHIRVIQETQVLRSSSVASSTRSNNSSRASSLERERTRMDEMGESDYDSRDDASYRSNRRRRSGDRRSSSHGTSLAQKMHRTRSPLVGAKPGKPTRNVFQNGDEQWIDEEEERYAGGLGQASSTGVEGKGAMDKWAGRAVDSGHGIRGRRKASLLGTAGRRRNGSDEERDLVKTHNVRTGLKSTGNPAHNIAGGANGVKRTGLRERTRGAPAIQEEDEEEEEDE